MMHKTADAWYGRLRRRLTAVCAAATGLVLVGMALVSMGFSVGQLRGQADEAFQSNLSAVFFYLRGQTLIDHVWLGQTESESDLYIRIELQGSALLYNSGHPRRAALTEKAAEAARGYGFDPQTPPSGTLQADAVLFTLADGDGEYRAAAAAVPSAGAWYSVIILKDMAREKAQIAGVRAVFLVSLALSLGVLAAVAWFFTAWAVRPVQESQRRQAEFISAASHELRSPLAVMKVSAETIRAAPPAEAGRFALKIERECDRLSRLTEDLLRLARSDSGGLAMDFSPEEPETIALMAAERFEELAARGGVRLAVELPDEPLLRVLCDGERVGQLLAILLDNAVRHTPDGGIIRLLVFRRRRALCFAVADSGPGIPDAEKDRVFDRFYQGDASRTSKAHYGLGLAVAREIAQLHRGTLTLRDSEEGGALFTLALPL